MACFVAFDLCFAGEDHLSPPWSPRLYTPDDDVVPHFQLRETPIDEEATHVMS